MDIGGLRDEYPGPGIDPADLMADPLAQLRSWLEDALAAGVAEPNAMTLATSDRSGRPSARMVLLKDLDDEGLMFFTNVGSRKGRELLAVPHAALTFWWPAMARQVVARGTAAPVGEEEADTYFARRPRESQLSAWASPQSQVVASRAELERRREDAARRYAGQPVPRPAQWGGFRVRPVEMEFWQGRPGRLHDRVRYVRAGGDLAWPAEWQRERLAP